MSIPDFQSIMLPLLELAGDGKEHYIHDSVERLADHFQLTEAEKTALLPSGQQPTFYNRVGWARTYLKKAGLFETPRRGYFQITPRGQEVLKIKPVTMDMDYLKRFPEYIKFRETHREGKISNEEAQAVSELTPEEALEDAYQKIRDDLSNQLLEYVVNSSSVSLRN